MPFASPPVAADRDGGLILERLCLSAPPCLNDVRGRDAPVLLGLLSLGGLAEFFCRHPHVGTMGRAFRDYGSGTL